MDILTEEKKTDHLTINDIYAGKPDAGDEIRERGYDEFASNYIQPTGVNITGLASSKYGTPFFIIGDKGTGKTALLHFLEKHICTIDEAACPSFLYFESDFSQVERAKFDSISRTISTSVSIDNTIAIDGNNVECDFSYIWKWQIYQKIITDNEAFNGGLFYNDDNSWSDFVSEVSKVSKTIDHGRMRIPAKISIKITSNPNLGTVTPGLEIEPVDFSKSDFHKTESYREFVEIIDRADKLLSKVKRTDIPYYVFIDELEAYRGENDRFYRDLRMIRDLLFTVKKMNAIFQDGTKFICSIRPEILNAISRFVQPNQLHKIMQGYDERLIWEHTNTNSFNHPIIGILLQRIRIAEERYQHRAISDSEIIKKWFVPNVYNKHICTYILDNTWHKPRDIVRLLLSAQARNSKNSKKFNQYVFETFMPEYSKQCLVEVREEMFALYTPEDVEQIFNCLQGFKSSFSYQEICIRAKRLYPDSVFAKQTYAVLSDMYRIGIIGNSLGSDRSPRWEYKQQHRLIIDDPWEIIIHPSLHIELSVSGRNDKHIMRSAKKAQNKTQHNNKTVFSATIKEVCYSYILVSFTKDNKIQKGFIGVKHLHMPDAKEGSLNGLFKEGDVVTARIGQYDSKYSFWYMEKI